MLCVKEFYFKITLRVTALYQLKRKTVSCLWRMGFSVDKSDGLRRTRLPIVTGNHLIRANVTNDCKTLPYANTCIN